MTNKNMKNRKRAQGLTEYIMIVALVAIAVLVGAKEFGFTVRKKFDESKDTIGSSLNTNAETAGKPSK